MSGANIFEGKTRCMKEGEREKRKEQWRDGESRMEKVGNSNVFINSKV